VFYELTLRKDTGLQTLQSEAYDLSNSENERKIIGCDVFLHEPLSKYENWFIGIELRKMWLFCIYFYQKPVAKDGCALFYNMQQEGWEYLI
jgi:hypothetical protein